MSATAPEVARPEPSLAAHCLPGVYGIDNIYETLHRKFVDDKDAYPERPGGRSAGACVLVDDNGNLLPQSAVLSSALWALGRLHDPGPSDPSWSEGFEFADREFSRCVDEYEGARTPLDEEKNLPLDADAVLGLLQITHERAGLQKGSPLASDLVVIKSVARTKSWGRDDSGSEFLNSFFLRDLDTVLKRVAIEGVPPALSNYLAENDDLRGKARVDVIEQSAEVDAGVVLRRLPKGRWPSNPDHPLALSQQFAVNSALNDLASTGGLMGVNGPPGTGKTTMLRDILAGNVVERARQLAALPSPADAFTKVVHRWRDPNNYDRVVHQLCRKLTGFEMVVASSNNAAVENVSNEIPVLGAIDSRWRGKVDYFTKIASLSLTKAAQRESEVSSEPMEAWGLVAARLGNKQNRSDFRSAFWFGKGGDDGGGAQSEKIPGMWEWFQDLKPKKGEESKKTLSWGQAHKDFKAAEKKVDELLDVRSEAEEWIALSRERSDRVRDEERERDRILSGLDLMETEFRRRFPAVVKNNPFGQQIDEVLSAEKERFDRHLAAKPGVLETLFTLGRVVRDWRRELDSLKEELDWVEELRSDVAILQEELRERESTLACVRAELEATLSKMKLDEERFGDAYPGKKWVGDARELRSPWLDAELNAARSDLFLAALELHKEFLAKAAAKMGPGLRAASEVVAGIHPPDLEPAKILAAWQLFFLAVPLVSTTFASVGPMLGRMGPKAIGWLLIDEAGQATPQSAVGAIWRAQRVVAVGDPLQLEPVFTAPSKMQIDMAATYGLDRLWTPMQSSVQSLADRVTLYGTTLPQEEGDVWVGAPLRVHRRCDDPMFTFCNQVAYNGIMINGVHRKLDDQDKWEASDTLQGQGIRPSSWLNVPALQSGVHLQSNQIKCAKQILDELGKRGVPPSEVIAVSPFRAVADALKGLVDDSGKPYKGLQAGTIHTAQGREASVVILVLGGDPNRPGAKEWASSKVNLVNVAASRAQRWLYVIGDRDSWAEYKYFQELSGYLVWADDPCERKEDPAVR